MSTSPRSPGREQQRRTASEYRMKLASHIHLAAAMDATHAAVACACSTQAQEVSQYAMNGVARVKRCLHTLSAHHSESGELMLTLSTSAHAMPASKWRVPVQGKSAARRVEIVARIMFVVMVVSKRKRGENATTTPTSRDDDAHKPRLRWSAASPQNRAGRSHGQPHEISSCGVLKHIGVRWSDDTFFNLCEAPPNSLEAPHDPSRQVD